MSAERETSAAVPGAAPTVFLAIELSKASWIVAVHSPAAARASLHRLPAGDARALLALAERARTMVLSIMAYSLSASPAKCLKTRSHTPVLAQRQKRVWTFFQAPNRSGRSRQGMPAR